MAGTEGFSPIFTAIVTVYREITSVQQHIVRADSQLALR
jgi:hypothetical protein